MSLLNYSTTVKSQKTASEIIEILVKAGARQVMSDFDNYGNASGLSFSISTPSGLRGFTLPVNANAVESVMRRDGKIPTRFKTPEQSRNVAWRIMKDWVEAQVALIETEMVTFEQVMLPYMRSIDGGTFYDEYLKGVGTQPMLEAGE